MIWKTEIPQNDVDKIYSYKKGSEERSKLTAKINEIKSTTIEIPLIINGKPVKTDQVFNVTIPHDHSKIIAKAYLAGPKEIDIAIKTSLAAQKQWAETDWYHRVAIFKKAADILGKSRRIENIAAIMVNQSKTPYQAEIDLAEMVDFLNYNARYLREIYEIQPGQSSGEQNRFDWRPLEGFILAIPPFNFYSIGGNLPTAPALAGNVVLWKPARSVIYSNFKIMEALIEAGLPAGVINFIPFSSQYSAPIFEHENFAGLHFTGSYSTLVHIWQTIGQNLTRFKNFPRIVGETGGKDFILMHNSADVRHTAINILRGGFEYQGQKCSACSRAYIPQSRWDEIKLILLEEGNKIQFGDISDFDYAGGAIIDEKAFLKIKEYLDYAKNHPETFTILLGGNTDDSKGWFVEPTIILSKDPKSKLMQDEIFGPVVTLYIYSDEDFDQTLKLIDETSPYALTGSIFSKDRYIVEKAEKELRYAAGNFYINDKPTGAIVNRQPFGGARASGTNDKAGSQLNILRWLSPRTIKETNLKVSEWQRAFMN